MIAFADAGEPGLLVLTVPAEFSASPQDCDCFAIPVMSRNGGFLVCVPRGAFSEDVLIDCLAGEDASLIIGPSKGVSVQLHEETEDQGVVQVPGSVNMLLVDLNDDAVGWLRDYDQNTDGVDTVLTLSQQNPFAVPIVAQLLPVAHEWLGNQESERVNFYSAQEEQDPPVSKKASAKPAAKSKGLPKRVTNAQVFEQLEVMVAQMKALSARTDMLEQAKTDGAKAAPEAGGGGFHLGVPAVSAGLPTYAAPPATAFAKYTALVGHPPKVKAPVPLVAMSTPAPAGSGVVPQEEHPDLGCSPYSAELGCACPCFSPGKPERSPFRDSRSRCSFYFHKRSSKAREDATGPWPWALLRFTFKSCNSSTRSCTLRCLCPRRWTS